MVTEKFVKELVDAGVIGGSGGNAKFDDFFHVYVNADGTNRFNFLGGSVYASDVLSHKMISCDIYLEANVNLTTEQSVFTLNDEWKEYGTTSLSFYWTDTDKSCTLSNAGNFNRKDNNIMRPKGYIYHYVFKVEIEEV